VNPVQEVEVTHKALVVLSGCGVFDGTEIHEAVVTLLALSRAGVDVQCAAPDRPQMHVINHLTGDVDATPRNVLVESARIARGKVVALSDVAIDDYDALFFPGGFGAAKNLTTFAVDGADCQIDPAVSRVLRGFHGAGKPICAVCIAPAVVAKALGSAGPELTIGNDPGTAEGIAALGGKHIECPVEKCHVDPENRIVTAPAYMYDATIADVAAGIEEAIQATLELL